jgi:hypothetical protein
MTVFEILEQAKALSLQERKELTKLLVDTLDAETSGANAEQPEIHWGKNLLRLLDELSPIDLDYPEIEDPVEWVKQIRLDQARERGLENWDEQA